MPNQPMERTENRRFGPRGVLAGMVRIGSVALCLASEVLQCIDYRERVMHRREGAKRLAPAEPADHSGARNDHGSVGSVKHVALQIFGDRQHDTKSP